MPRPRERAWLLLPLALAAAAYARVLDGQFQFDDFTNIEQNPGIKDLGRFAAKDLLWAWGGAGRPLADLTLALNYAAGGLDPVGYHAVNLAIHLAAVLLVHALARRVARLAGARRAEWIALAAAAAFALHPLQTQAVSYVVQRSESLASALYVGTLLLLLEAERRGRSPAGAAAWAGALAALTLALGAKQIALTAPAAYLLVALAVGGTPAARAELTTWPRRLALAAPLFAVAALSAVGTVADVGGPRPDVGFQIPNLSPRDYLLTQLRALVGYLRLLLWPSGQSAYWEFPVSRSPLEPAVLASAALLAALGCAAVVLLVRGRRSADPRGAAMRLAALGIAWFFLVLSVTSSVVPLADVFVEHRIYLASFGPFLALAAGMELLGDAATARRLAAGLAVLSCVLGGLTYRRNAVWETREALWRDVLERFPGSAGARLSLGFALAEQGRYREAVAEYHEGLRGAGGVPRLQARLLRNLGSAHVFLDERDAALAAFQQGLVLEPDDPEMIVNTALVLSRSGDLEGAERWVRRGLALAPRQPTGLNVLGVVLLRRSRWQEALETLDRAAAVNPDMGEVHVNRAIALERLGRKGEACAAWQEALRRRLAPRDLDYVQRSAEASCR